MAWERTASDVKEGFKEAYPLAPGRDFNREPSLAPASQVPDEAV